MAEDSNAVNELYGRSLNEKLWVLNGRLTKKEVKEEELKNIEGGINKEGEMITDDDGKGNDVSSVSDHPTQPTSVTTALAHQQTWQSQLMVKVKEEQTNGGESMASELQQLRAAAAANERTLKDKELLNSVLMAKLEQVRKEKKQLDDERRRQFTQLGSQLREEQKKNAQLTEELKLEKEKSQTIASSMNKESTVGQTLATTVSIHQPSRAAIAAQLLGIDRQLLDEARNEFKEKFEESEFNLRQMRNGYDALMKDYRQEQKTYSKVKQLYKAEQKVAAKLRVKLKEMEKLTTAIEPDVQQQPIEEANGPVTSPLDTIQLGATQRKRQRLLVPEQVDVELPPVAMGEDGGMEEGEEEGTGIGSGNGGRMALSTVGMKGNGDAKTVATVPAGGVFKCPTCPNDHVAYSTAEQLAKHQQRAHGDRQHFRHQCLECGLRCYTNFSLQNHMRTHSGEKPHKCRECGRGFAQKCDMTRHERVHSGERPYACAVCQKKFANSSHLVRHARIHTGETPFSCQHCARQFNDMSVCRNHEKICPKKRGDDSV